MKTIVITGTTSGIGKVLCEYFAKENQVFASYRNKKYLKDLQKFNITPFYLDMTDANSIREASEFIKSETNKIDILINVAGCVVAGLIENIDINRIREQFEINTFSHLDFSQRLLDLLDDGEIINFSSMASFGIFPFVGPYCASKRALDILFTSFINETKRNIKVISIKPGVIATPLWGKSIKINKNEINNCSGYEKEIQYIIQNAKYNQTNGLNVEEVLKLVKKIVNSKNPKPSYTIGFDAKIAEIISHLPQGIINKIIKYGLYTKIKKDTI